MNNTLDNHIINLPNELIREIFDFLVPNISKICFCKVTTRRNYDAYNMKYEIAYYNNIEMVNPNGLFLSRIYKKNGKHRYYITKEIVDTIEVDYSDRCIELFCYEYSSKYVGKNLKQAILQLLYDK